MMLWSLKSAKVCIAVMGLCLACCSSSTVAAGQKPPIEEGRARELIEQHRWPEDTFGILGDPSCVDVCRLEGGPEDGYLFGFRCGNVVEANRLIFLFSLIKERRLVLHLSPAPATRQWDWSISLRLAASQTASKPSLHVSTDRLGVGLDELIVPLNVHIQAPPVDAASGKPAADSAAARFARAHARKQDKLHVRWRWQRVACPQWARVEFPRELRRWQGPFGLPVPHPTQDPKNSLNVIVAGIDVWQGNHFLMHNDKTHDYIYGDVAPFRFAYRKGTLPVYERLVAEYTSEEMTDREKAVKLLTVALPDNVRHPTVPPVGGNCALDRAMDDCALLASRKAWCNEQARVFVRMCQVAGVPARMLFLFYDGGASHVLSEFYADGHWALADSSYICVFPDKDGRLMSADECLNDPDKNLRAGEAYFQRMKELDRLSDEELVGCQFADKPYAKPQDEAARSAAIKEAADQMRKRFFRRSSQQIADELWRFGVLPYPLPPEEPLKK